jgi:hypothetical protein
MLPIMPNFQMIYLIKTCSRTYWFMFYKFEKVVLPHIENDDHKKIILDLFKNFLKQGYI